MILCFFCSVVMVKCTTNKLLKIFTSVLKMNPPNNLIHLYIKKFKNVKNLNSRAQFNHFITVVKTLKMNF